MIRGAARLPGQGTYYDGDGAIPPSKGLPAFIGDTDPLAARIHAFAERVAWESGVSRDVALVMLANSTMPKGAGM